MLKRSEMGVKVKRGSSSAEVEASKPAPDPTPSTKPDDDGWLTPEGAARLTAESTFVPTLDQPAPTTITVTSGREAFFVGDSGFEIGPVSVTLITRPNECARELYLRARGELEVMMEMEFRLKRASYLSHNAEIEKDGS